MAFFLKTLCVLILLQAIDTQTLSRISLKNGRFVDSQGNVKLFHGANYVNKFFSWVPRALREDITMDKLKEMGLNVVRLGIMWTGLVPQQNYVNYTYLDEMAGIVERLAQRGIYTIIEFHQDALSSKFGTYDGVPRWVIDLMPPSPNAFPYPVSQSLVDSTYTAAFASKACGYAYQNLYSNKNNFQTYLSDYWTIVSKRFASFSSVIGYELMNEPWFGDVYANPLLLSSGFAGLFNLMPMYTNLAKTIRKNDLNGLIFFEPALGAISSSSFLLGTGFTRTPNNDPKSVLAWHFYCWFSESLPLLGLSQQKVPLSIKSACGDIQGNSAFIAMNKTKRQLNSGSFLTEFGSCVFQNANGVYDTSQCEQVLNRADTYFESWAYWDLNFFQNENGAPNFDIIKKFSRVYPRSTSCTPVAMSYNTDTFSFSYEYTPSSTNAAPTEIFVPATYVFTNGFDVTVTPAQAASYTYDAAKQTVFITLSQSTNSNILVKIMKKP